MPRTAYRKGRDAEYAIKRKLEGMGYKWQIRSSASHTPIDLLVSDGVTCLALQVKVRPYLSKSDRSELIEWAKRFNANPMLACKKRGRWRLESLQS